MTGKWAPAQTGDCCVESPDTHFEAGVRIRDPHAARVVQVKSDGELGVFLLDRANHTFDGCRSCPGHGVREHHFLKLETVLAGNILGLLDDLEHCLYRNVTGEVAAKRRHHCSSFDVYPVSLEHFHRLVLQRDVLRHGALLVADQEGL